MIAPNKFAWFFYTKVWCGLSVTMQTDKELYVIVYIVSEYFQLGLNIGSIFIAITTCYVLYVKKLDNCFHIIFTICTDHTIIVSRSGFNFWKKKTPETMYRPRITSRSVVFHLC